jgi:glucan phosphoethanolaminetransferase (alkaline phosphatase superfamily)
MKPKTPLKAPKMKYKVPIVLWFVEKIQRTIHGFSKKTINENQNKHAYKNTRKSEETTKSLNGGLVAKFELIPKQIRSQRANS